MEERDPVYIPDDWTQRLNFAKLFEREAPVEVDLGCGKGHFLYMRSVKFPERNFIGVDRQLVRIRKTLKKVGRLKRADVRLLRIEIAYALEYLFPDASVDVYYLFFPDPWPKRRHHRRRAVNAGFLDQVYRTLKPEGVLNIATDHLEYFADIMSLLEADARFERIETFVTAEDEKTEFERLFIEQGLEIGRVSVRKRA